MIELVFDGLIALSAVAIAAFAAVLIFKKSQSCLAPDEVSGEYAMKSAWPLAAQKFVIQGAN